MKYLILCPLKPELEAVKVYFETAGFELEARESKLGSYFQCKDLGCVLAFGGLGQKRYSEKALRYLKLLSSVTTLICAGTAGALSPHLATGDVICDENFDEALLSKLKSSNFGIHRGRFFYADKPIEEGEEAEKIFSSTGAAAIVLEGLTPSSLARDPSLGLGLEVSLEIRGITDFANQNLKKDFNSNLSPAMAHVAETLLQILAYLKV